MRLLRTGRRALTVAVMLLSALVSRAQTYVSGQVVDSVTGEPVEFAALFFAGTTVGTEADAGGRFELETDNPEAYLLCCRMMGYEPQSVEVPRDCSTSLRFCLVPSGRQIDAASVKADNSRARALLDSIDVHRARNSPELLDSYSCSVYNKTDLGAGGGVDYIPMLVCESMLQLRHAPDYLEENIEAVQMTGYAPDAKLLAQFSGSTRPRIDFYSENISLPGIDLPSPASSRGLLHYDYFMVDSLSVDGRSTLKLHYRPKPGSNSAAFQGEMLVDLQDYALRGVKAGLRQGSNINWLRAFSISVDYDRTSEGTWFYDRENLFADFTLAVADSSSSSVISAYRELEYFNLSLDAVERDPQRLSRPLVMDPDAFDYSESWWDAARPSPLGARDLQLRARARELEKLKRFRVAYDVVRTAATGYLELGKIELGPYYKLLSYNNLEGLRLQLGLRTTPSLMKDDRLSAFFAWGFADACPKGALSWEHLFRRAPDFKLTAAASYDVLQLGQGSAASSENGIFTSVLTRQGLQRLCPQSSISATLEREFGHGIGMNAGFALRRLQANAFVPMGTFDSLSSNEIHAGLRWARGETIFRGAYSRTQLYTRYPVLSLDLTASIPGLRKGDVGFVRPELGVDWAPNMGMLGHSDLHVSGGTILGTLPYVFLHLPEGNPSYISDPTAFACLDYFEYVSDSWVSLRWNHNFNGLLLGWIPFVNRLNLREEIAFRSLWGSLSDKNNPAVNPFAVPFPGCMKPLGGMPYCEFSAGIGNILRIFRFDCSWRLSCREEGRRNFAIGVGMEFKL